MRDYFKCTDSFVCDWGPVFRWNGLLCFGCSSTRQQRSFSDSEAFLFQVSKVEVFQTFLASSVNNILHMCEFVLLNLFLSELLVQTCSAVSSIRTDPNITAPDDNPAWKPQQVLLLLRSRLSHPNHSVTCNVFALSSRRSVKFPGNRFCVKSV